MRGMTMKAAKKIALLGFDCALTNLVRKHIAEGIAPNFKKIFENGTVAENCLVPFPTITPPNWTVMATGAWLGNQQRHRLLAACSRYNSGRGQYSQLF